MARRAQAVTRLGLALVLGLVGTPARAEPPSPRHALARQLGDEAAVIEAAITTVSDKLATLDAVRLARLRALYPVLRTRSVRARAGARLIVERELAERRLLADELDLLRGAAERTARDSSALATLASPPALVSPSSGTIARRFGTFTHERSRATLSRRGIDLEVELHAPVVAPADGIVRFAGPIRGLDQGVVIDHGGYVSVIAKLDEIAVPQGAPVTAGARIARAARRRVYLEVRAGLGPGGRPIDPEPLLHPSPQTR
jgi:murein hydrolase activator